MASRVFCCTLVVDCQKLAEVSICLNMCTVLCEALISSLVVLDDCIRLLLTDTHIHIAV